MKAGSEPDCAGSMRFAGRVKDAKVMMLLDSGSEGNFPSNAFANEAQLTTRRVASVISVRSANQQSVEVTHSVRPLVRLGPVVRHINFFLLPIALP